ncbi:conserved hypothetical protein [Xenorhabdus bovienii str. kraussei Quebec]|uniref:Uncharacterized protein n=1 Tax=Xenorhabdus bovienii str. kraussei Quebec TaxID=1398203 RepID=A0A077PBN8_XENBV|nr:conserved hypothetical protein [Xenorhabdus bovienii str. kraussei Quebec]
MNITQSPNSGLDRNPLIYIQTPHLASGYTLTKLPNSLIFNQAANMQSAHNLSVSNADSQNLHNSLRGAQAICGSFSDAVNLRPSFSQAQKEKDSTANATLWNDGSFHHKINQSVNRKADLLYEEEQTVNYNSLRDVVRFPDNIGLVSYCSDDALVLRWRRLISPCNAVTINCAVLSPGSFNDSTLSAISCGTRALIFCDLLLTLSRVITALHICLWVPVYTKIIIKKVLKWVPICIYTGCQLNVAAFNKNKAPSDCSPSGASDHYVTEINAMAIQQHTQTRLKFTFLIASGTQRLVDIHPVRLITVLSH